VTDSDDNEATSAPVAIHVGLSVAIISVSPQANISPDGVAITATASDADGSVFQVEFFVDDGSLGHIHMPANGIHSANWVVPRETDTYALTAVATNHDGRTTESEPATVSVDASVFTSSVTATHDASLREGSPSSTANWGDVEVYGNSGAQIVGVFKFDISSFADADVTTALLRLYVVTVRGTGGEFSAFRATGDNWQEDSVTWNNGPSKGALVSTQYIDSTNRWYEFDMTQYVADKVNAGATELTIWIEDASTTNEKFECDSRRSDQDNPPELTVTARELDLTVALEIPGDDSEDCSWVAQAEKPEREEEGGGGGAIVIIIIIIAVVVIGALVGGVLFKRSKDRSKTGAAGLDTESAISGSKEHTDAELDCGRSASASA
jgi:hypothetical protein